MLDKSKVKELIRMGIEEDTGSGDVTSLAIFPKGHRSSAQVIAKADGVFCGGDLFTWVYHEVDSSVHVKTKVKEGEFVKSTLPVIELEGPTISLLGGERVALNFLQRMSGIATATRNAMKILEGTSITILDTRKTLPGFRAIDKYSVKIGGGTNHRIGLFDMVLIKDNHIKAAGSIEEAVKRVKERWGKTYLIEVETTTIEEVKSAVASGVEIVMLDNMSVSEMEKAIESINGQAKIEVSGNVDLQRLQDLRSLKIDFISMGSLTHSVCAFDLSMKFE